MNAPGNPSPGWYPDPSGRHQVRYWDGSAWTAHVSSGGVASVDDPTRPAPPVQPPVAPPPSYGYGSAPSGYHPVPQPSPAGSWATGQATIPPVPPGTTWAPNSYGQPYAPAGAPPLASLGDRFGGYLLDGLLGLVTLGIGWIIWCCFTFSKGQTPAKAMMGMRVVKQDTGIAATWGEMFLRNVVIPGALGLVGIFLFGIPTIVAACMIFGGTLRQTGWDRMVGTVVVKDPQGVTVPAGYWPQRVPAVTAGPDPVDMRTVDDGAPAAAGAAQAAIRVRLLWAFMLLLLVVVLGLAEAIQPDGVVQGHTTQNGSAAADCTDMPADEGCPPWTS